MNIWLSLKSVFEQHFGIAIELETLKIRSDEFYLDFCNSIQHTKNTLLAKVNLILNSSLRESEIVIYYNFDMNVFLYNLPEDLLRIVRLKVCTSLEHAISVVLEEVSFMH